MPNIILQNLMYLIPASQDIKLVYKNKAEIQGTLESIIQFVSENMLNMKVMQIMSDCDTLIILVNEHDKSSCN